MTIFDFVREMEKNKAKLVIAVYYEPSTIASGPYSKSRAQISIGLQGDRQELMGWDGELTRGELINALFVMVICKLKNAEICMVRDADQLDLLYDLTDMIPRKNIHKRRKEFPNRTWYHKLLFIKYVTRPGVEMSSSYVRIIRDTRYYGSELRMTSRAILHKSYNGSDDTWNE